MLSRLSWSRPFSSDCTIESICVCELSYRMKYRFSGVPTPGILPTKRVNHPASVSSPDGSSFSTSIRRSDSDLATSPPSSVPCESSLSGACSILLLVADLVCRSRPMASTAARAADRASSSAGSIDSSCSTWAAAWARRASVGSGSGSARSAAELGTSSTSSRRRPDVAVWLPVCGVGVAGACGVGVAGVWGASVMRRSVSKEGRVR